MLRIIIIIIMNLPMCEVLNIFSCKICHVKDMVASTYYNIGGGNKIYFGLSDPVMLHTHL